MPRSYRPRMRWDLRAVIALPLLTLALTDAAAGHEPPPLFAHEADVLGAQHAAEHAVIRAASRRAQAKRDAMTPAQRRAEARRTRVEAVSYARSTRGNPSQVGRWTQRPRRIPEYAIHSVLLPTGKVLFWGYPPPDQRRNVGSATLWDPREGRGPAAFEAVPPPSLDPDGDGPQEVVPAPIYCSGQSLLPSGEVLVAGGTLAWPGQDDEYPGWAGLNTVLTFDPWTETWHVQPSMNDGHWYPGQALLADGRTAILGGYGAQAPGEIVTDDLEMFSAAPGAGETRSLTHQASADRETGLYPHLFTIPSGDLLLAGPARSDSAILPVWAGGPSPAWSKVPDAARTRLGGTAVIEPEAEGASWSVSQLGGWHPRDGFWRATRSTETLDASEPAAGWKPGPRMRRGRSYHNTVLLPDLSKVTIGGGIGFSNQTGNYAVDETGTRRRVELYDPRREAWKLGPAQLEDRAYHSTAILLPDGRVWSAGDDFHGPSPFNGFSRVDTAEVYSPPYLFRGRRPLIASAPEEIGWHQSFRVDVAGAPSARRAVLVAPGATTHASDMHQRVVSLTASGRDARRARPRWRPTTQASPRPAGTCSSFSVATECRPWRPGYNSPRGPPTRRCRRPPWTSSWSSSRSTSSSRLS